MTALQATIPHLRAARVAPHRLGGHTTQEILRAWSFAAGIAAIFGVVLFGLPALILIVIAMTCGAVCDFAFSALSGRSMIGGPIHSVLSGLLLALTLPPHTPWYVAIIGTFVAVIAAKGVFNSMGYYLWQPALVGRVFVQFVFSGTLGLAGMQTQWPVLAPGHLLFGHIEKARPVDLATYGGYFGAAAPTDEGLDGAEAWLMPPPAAILREFAEGRSVVDGDLIFIPLLRDRLPPWPDTVVGTVAGGIGETCTLGLVIAGLYLMYRGYLRWQLPVAIIASAALTAAILPIEWPPPQGGFDWLPGFTVENDRAVGLAYVLYHLTSGPLMLCAFLMAGDMISSPRRARGQIAFGIGIGVLTIFLRLYGVVSGDCYWAILVMNTFVPLINKQSRKEALGLATS